MIDLVCSPVLSISGTLPCGSLRPWATIQRMKRLGLHDQYLRAEHAQVALPVGVVVLVQPAQRRVETVRELGEVSRAVGETRSGIDDGPAFADRSENTGPT